MSGMKDAWSELISAVGIAKMSLMKPVPDSDRAMEMLEKVSDSLDTILAARLRGEAAHCSTCGGSGFIDHNLGAGIGRITEDEFCPQCDGDTKRTRAAQGEQQAVAWIVVDDPVGNERGDWDIEFNRQLIAEFDAGRHALYTRPQPVAVAGDAYRVALQAIADSAPSPCSTLTGDALRRMAREALSAAPAAPAGGLADELDFEPDEHHTIADMANVGYSLMQAIKSNCPGYCWAESPAEIVVDLINQRDEAAGIVPDGAAAPSPVAGDAVAGLPAKWRIRAQRMRDNNPRTETSNVSAFENENNADELDAALAQDRASQAGAAGVPVLHQWQIDSLRYGLRLSPETHADDQIELALSAALLAAAPTPAAEGEVRRD